MNALKSFAKSSQLASLVNWGLLLGGIWLTVNFVWSFWPQVPTQAVATVEKKDSTTKTFNLQSVIDAELFGSAAAVIEEQPEEISAPVTRLNLKLRGVYSSEEDFATAMIEHNRKQEVYRIGSSLPGASGLKLYRVLADRVIMSRNGKYETLYIEDFDGSTPTTNTQFRPRTSNAQIREPVTADENSDENSDDDINVVDLTNNAQVTAQLLELRQNMDDPDALNDVVSMSPVSDEQGFQGFKLAPGKNRRLFGAMGLRRNDVVTEVNGISMTDASSALTVLDQLQTAEEINLTVKRGEREVLIKISAPAQ
jgi:general secretion pathway protein C